MNCKKNYLVLFLIFGIISNLAFAQKTDDISPKIANIKKLYKEIKNNEKNYKKEEITKFDEDGFEEITEIYKSGTEIKKIAKSISGPGDCGESYEFYFNKSEVFFVFFVSSCYVDERVIKSEKRYYFDGNKLIQYLDGKKSIKQGTEEFTNEENAIKHLISELKVYSK